MSTTLRSSSARSRQPVRRAAARSRTRPGGWWCWSWTLLQAARLAGSCCVLQPAHLAGACRVLQAAHLTGSCCSWPLGSFKASGSGPRRQRRRRQQSCRQSLHDALSTAPDQQQMLMVRGNTESGQRSCTPKVADRVSVSAADWTESRAYVLGVCRRHSPDNRSSAMVGAECRPCTLLHGTGPTRIASGPIPEQSYQPEEACDRNKDAPGSASKTQLATQSLCTVVSILDILQAIGAAHPKRTSPAHRPQPPMAWLSSSRNPFRR